MSCINAEEDAREAWYDEPPPLFFRASPSLHLRFLCHPPNSRQVILRLVLPFYSMKLQNGRAFSYGHGGAKSGYGSDAAHHSGSSYDTSHAGHDGGSSGYYSGNKDAEHSAAAKAASGVAHESEAHGGGTGNKYSSANSDFGKGKAHRNIKTRVFRCKEQIFRILQLQICPASVPRWAISQRRETCPKIWSRCPCRRSKTGARQWIP